MQEIFRYRASKEYIKDGMRYADEARANNLWLLAAQLGVIAWSLTGDHATALGYAQEALRRLDREPALKPQLEPTFTEFVGVLLVKVKRPQDALPYFTKLEAMYRSKNDRKGELGAWHQRAYALQAAGDYAGAITTCEAILREKDKLDKETVPQVMLSLAKFLQDVGDFPKSLAMLKDALAVAEQLLKETPEPPEPNLDTHFKTMDQDPEAGKRYTYRSYKANKAEILAALASYYDFAGDYETALKRYQDAVDIEAKLMISGTRKDELFEIARKLIIVHKKLGNMKKAFDIIGSVKNLAEKNDIPTTDIELTYGEFLLSYITHPQHGPESTRKAIDIFQRNNRPDLLGVVYLKQKNFAGAKEQFKLGVERALNSREADKLVGTHIGLGLACEGLNELDDADKALRKAVALMENQRDTLSPGDRAAFFSGEVVGLARTQAYESLVRVYVKQGRIDDAFKASENIKARRLAEAIAAGRSALSLSLPPDLRAREEKLNIDITRTVRELEDAFKRKATGEYALKERALEVLRADRERFAAELRGRFPDYASLRYPSPLTPPEVWLATTEALVAFEVTEAQLFVFVVHDGKSRVIVKDVTREDLRTQVDDIRAAFTAVSRADDLAKFNPNKALALYKALFDGVFDGIPETTRTMIVPDEFLAVLPFDALVVEQKTEQMGQNQFGPFPLGVTYLGEKRPLGYAQSATALSIARALDPPVSSKKLLALADPVFSAKDKRATGAVAAETALAANEWKKMGVAGSIARTEAQKQAQGAAAAEPDVFPRLDKTSLLADKLKSFFGADATLLVGKNAKEATVRQQDLSGYRFLTFATHGILDDTLPYVREPALVLSLVGNPAGDDGFLTASEVMALKLNADVVALTACQTGVGRNVSGEGVMGLGRAFEYAGAKRVLMSLWEVSEDSTTLLASQFFKYMKDGQDAQLALMNARKDVRAKGYENPFYWAAFTLMGAGAQPQQRMAVAVNAPASMETKPTLSITTVLSDLVKEAEANKPPPPVYVPPPYTPPPAYEPPAPYEPPPEPKPKIKWEPPVDYGGPVALRSETWDFGRMSAVGASFGYHGVAEGHYFTAAPFIAFGGGDEKGHLQLTLGAPINFTINDPQSGAPGGTIRRRDWDEWRDYLKIAHALELNYHADGGVLDARLGRIAAFDLASGGAMRAYSNGWFADIWRVGGNVTYGGRAGEMQAIITDFGFQSTLVGLYAGLRPFALARVGVPQLESMQLGVLWTGDFSAPTALKLNDDGFTVKTSLQFYPEADVRGIHILGGDFSITPVSYSFFRARTYLEFDQIVALGNGVSAGLDLSSVIPKTGGLELRARVEYRNLGSQYMPGYFDNFYEVQRLHFFSGDPTTSDITKATFLTQLTRSARAHNFWGDFSVGYASYAGVGVTFESGGYGVSSSMTLHAQSQVSKYMTLFFTYQKRNFTQGQNSELFRFIQNDLLSAYLRVTPVEWLSFYGRVARAFTWDLAEAGVGRLRGTWDATASIEIGYPLRFKK
ncbi:MAG: CHAT domain-containing protein [Deltaproteobacteria bacterium]|nr:CHAT domain-containing protein [Deltaproteobacteria bacterium]